MNDRSSRLTVRVKLVDLNYAGGPARKSLAGTTVPRSSAASVSSLVGSTTERNPDSAPVGLEAGISAANPTGEICLKDRQTVEFAEFENHIEQCSVCASRVDLQLDFIETLEVAMYQRRAEPKSSRIRGALLISAPKLNFAICGEIDF